MASLKELYEYIRELRFPLIPENDLLNDIFADLVLLDGEYIGLASSYMGSGDIELKNISDIEDLIKRVDEFKKSELNQSDLKIYFELKIYITALYNLALSLKESVKKYKRYKE